MRPNRHLSALLTFFALLPLVYFIPPRVAAYVDSHWWVTVISVGLIVPMISYVLLPAMFSAISHVSASREAE
ncbi:hypothetical protein Mag101_01270 [Microbulbifer agarilyticus]|uniref:DUF3311 domain-containing protein n=1 Tax=Microbulbifer agarilyticus TaxID=260552 RepID=A0A1Q2M9G8_9GAMM|nr:hypothetical protein Mag101_01270 [Microbulbifer agarilyticus]